MSKNFSTAMSIACLVVIAAITATVYFPSVHGWFVFDDYPNIVDNPAVHLHSLQWKDLQEAALASPVSQLPRPLSMLSFALNWFASDGANAHEMKLTNILIHLCNGFLLWLVVRQIVRFAQTESKTVLNGNLMALLVASMWLLAPINFTAVAYVVQRMESLCQLFVLLGLYTYLRTRQRARYSSGNHWLPAFCLVAFTLVAVSAKESGCLLPLYACIVDWCITGFRDHAGTRERKMIFIYAAILWIPALIASTALAIHYLPAATWSSRSFTLSERLLTEPRILFDYIGWTLLPLPNSLALYHDNISVSSTLVDPPATLLAITGIIALLSCAVLIRHRYPIVAIGLLWFFAGHLLTATFIPLELAFEHRNYFSSAGIFLASSALLSRPRLPFPLARITLALAFFALISIITGIRSVEWGNPLSFATSEADKNPRSPRTMYELGRTLVIYSQYHADSPFVARARDVLISASAMRGADALPDQALIILAGNTHTPPPNGIWDSFEHKLTSQPLTVENLSALYAVVSCAANGICDNEASHLSKIFDSVVLRNPRNIRLLSIYANFAANVLKDLPMAIQLTKQTIAIDSKSLQLRINELVLLDASGDLAGAREAYTDILRDIPDAANDEVIQQWKALLEEPTQGESDGHNSSN